VCVCVCILMLDAFVAITLITYALEYSNRDTATPEKKLKKINRFTRPITLSASLLLVLF
jgi:hypothetical protein